ncbi:MAG: hypothetical protein ACJAU6_000118 [Alphaproteobacteria bacterium]|jgi:uncharacterized protein YjiS (DUF1127 family)
MLMDAKTRRTGPASTSAQSVEPWLGWTYLVQLWCERRRQRRALARLDDRLLRDIGISKRRAKEESEKTFWR